MATPLLSVVEQLLTDSDAAAAFKEAPGDFLSALGLDDFSAADVIDALALGFDSIVPDVAQRLILPDSMSDDASAADALTAIFDAAPAESVLDDAAADTGLDLDFGLGDGLGDAATEGHDADNLDFELDLDLGTGLDSVDDLDTATFDQGFGNGAHDLDVDHLHDVDDLHFDADHGDADLDGLL